MSLLGSVVNTYTQVAGWIGDLLSSTDEADYPASQLTKILRESNVLSPEERVINVEIQPLGGGGYVGTIYKLSLVCGNEVGERDEDLVLKTSGGAEGKAFSIRLSGYREAVFYNTFARTTCKDIAVPSHHAYSNRLTGKYSILMKNMSHNYVGVDLLLGNKIWGLPEGFNRTAYQSEAEVLRGVCMAAGRFHAKHWNDKDLLKCEWLKGVDNIQGRGRVWWEMSVEKAKAMWRQRRKSVKYSERVLKVMQASLSASVFSHVVEKVNKGPYTLCHGDWHASNMFMSRDGELRVCDWCNVSAWNPLRDLSQFFLSDVDLDRHASSLPDLVRVYYTTLRESGADLTGYSYDACWSDFVFYAVSRWVYALPVMDCLPGVSDSLMQYFNKQLTTFIEAHCEEESHVFPIMPVGGFY
eukprot:TRINITY_DN37285_c0_g1_i1.p1 TRINITY_DN37285_c0_g1~~TRINITY_DN37285_c0_g1_i1.p1  ORF type:complete len:411 (+),score=67.78 TRINITY_DN37285_c0_g1_i1:34-1266(+)